MKQVSFFKTSFSGLIYLLVLFIPFEVMLLKYLPVSENAYVMLRYAFEIFIYLLFATMVLNKFSHKRKVNGSPIDFPVIIFLLLTFVTIIVNHAPLFEAFVGFKSAFRFLLLFYVLINFEFNEGLLQRMLMALVAVASLQALLSFHQHFFGISQFWYPRAINLTMGSKDLNFKILKGGYHGGIEQGAVIGTFGDSIALATFLVIILIVMLAFLFGNHPIGKYIRLMLWTGVILIIVALFFTYSRGSAIIGILAIPAMMLLAGKTKLFSRFALLSVLFFAVVLIKPALSGREGIRFVNPKFKYVDPVSNITVLLSEQYANNTFKHARGWILENVGGSLLKSITMIGYSPANEFALQKLLKKEMNVLTPFENLLIINDVFWVAFIAYYGLVGMIVFLSILYLLFKASRYVWFNTGKSIYRVVSLATITLIIASIPYSFIVATFTFRSFGLYFWLLAGLTISEYLRLKKNRNESTIGS
jgi:hypothetical protein